MAKIGDALYLVAGVNIGVTAAGHPGSLSSVEVLRLHSSSQSRAAARHDDADNLEYGWRIRHDMTLPQSWQGGGCCVIGNQIVLVAGMRIVSNVIIHIPSIQALHVLPYNTFWTVRSHRLFPMGIRDQVFLTLLIAHRLRLQYEESQSVKNGGSGGDDHLLGIVNSIPLAPEVGARVLQASSRT